MGYPRETPFPFGVNTGLHWPVNADVRCPACPQRKKVGDEEVEMWLVCAVLRFHSTMHSAALNSTAQNPSARGDADICLHHERKLSGQRGSLIKRCLTFMAPCCITVGLACRIYSHQGRPQKFGMPEHEKIPISTNVK